VRYADRCRLLLARAIGKAEERLGQFLQMP
jgi:hypothetical protein